VGAMPIPPPRPDDAPKPKLSITTADLMAVLEGVTDGVVRLDRAANYMSINGAAAEIFTRLGRDPDAMIGESVWTVFPDLKGTIVERELRRLLEDDIPIQCEFHYPADKDRYEMQGFPCSPGAILIFRDITHRKTNAV
jgi:PAS domain-containing protein